jgi:hypothetical protein
MGLDIQRIKKTTVIEKTNDVSLHERREGGGGIAGFYLCSHAFSYAHFRVEEKSIESSVFSFPFLGGMGRDLVAIQ